MNNPYAEALRQDLNNKGWRRRPANDGFYNTIVHKERLAAYYVNIMSLDSPECKIEIRKFDQAINNVVYCYIYPDSVENLISFSNIDDYIEDLILKSDNQYLDDHYSATQQGGWL